jgi:hypothetical protein
LIKCFFRVRLQFQDLFLSSFRLESAAAPLPFFASLAVAESYQFSEFIGRQLASFSKDFFSA